MCAEWGVIGMHADWGAIGLYAEWGVIGMYAEKINGKTSVYFLCCISLFFNK